MLVTQLMILTIG